MHPILRPSILYGRAGQQSADLGRLLVRSDTPPATLHTVASATCAMKRIDGMGEIPLECAGTP
jgi:hypothetical protein